MAADRHLPDINLEQQQPVVQRAVFDVEPLTGDLDAVPVDRSAGRSNRGTLPLVGTR